MGMYDGMLQDLTNTVILLCQHMRKLLTLLEAYTDMDKEEKFLSEIEKKYGAESEDDDA